MLNDLGILYGSIDLYDHAVDAYEEALKINPKLISALANLAGIIHTAVGNISYAEELYLQSINVANPNANPLYGYGSLYHNYGVFLRDIGRSKESISYFEKSLDIDKNLFQSFYNIAECECRKGSPTNINKAQSLYEKAMNIIELSDDNDSYWSVNIVKKTSVVPYLSEKIDTILSNRHEYINNINEMISKMITAKLNMSNDYDFVSKPINYIGCASLGYYIIYHGYEDLYVRQLLGMLYFVSSKNLLQFTSPYLINLSESINYISKVNHWSLLSFRDL
jgi:tetratricopeptide (TPR) repeat protein